MKYTRKYLEESSIHEGLGSSVAKLLYGVGGPLAAVAGIPTLATMAQEDRDPGLYKEQKLDLDKDLVEDKTLFPEQS